MTEKDELKISWYGRCSFLVEWKEKKVLFDPYDAFCNVEMGRVEADILVSSSTWHDHGNIGVSPRAYIYTYSGKYSNSGIKIYGIESKETRGTPNVIFNVKFGSFSVTNFADLGQEQDFSIEDRTVIESTNIAFVRPGDHYELALKYCRPKITIPEHYFPESFIEDHIPDMEKERFEKPNRVVNRMIETCGLPVEEINSHTIEINKEGIKTNRVIKFLKLHPQVIYK